LVWTKKACVSRPFFWGKALLPSGLAGLDWFPRKRPVIVIPFPDRFLASEPLGAGEGTEYADERMIKEELLFRPRRFLFPAIA